MPIVSAKPLWRSPRNFFSGIKLICRSIGRENVLVLGDSHIGVFAGDSLRRAFPAFFFDVCSVNGATASGLANPNSQTMAHAKFQAALKKSCSRRLIVCLGEVDTGFVLWYRAQKYGEPVDAMLNFAVQTYREFLNGIATRGREVICISAPLPTIKDGVSWGEVARARSEVNATQLQRTDLTLEFNRRMSVVCDSLGVIHLNLDAECLGEGGLVRPEMLNVDPKDHHYNPMVYAELLRKRLDPLLVQGGVS